MANKIHIDKAALAEHLLPYVLSGEIRPVPMRIFGQLLDHIQTPGNAIISDDGEIAITFAFYEKAMLPRANKGEQRKSIGRTPHYVIRTWEEMDLLQRLGGFNQTKSNRLSGVEFTLNEKFASVQKL